MTRLIYEHSSTDGTCVSPCVKACIEVFSEHIIYTERIVFPKLSFFVLDSLSVSPAYSVFILSFPLNLHSILLLFGWAGCVYELPRVTLYMVSECQGWEPLLPKTTRNRQTLISGEEQKERKKKWTEKWLARSRRRSSTEATTHPGRTRCTNTCSDMATKVMSTALTMQRLKRHTWNFGLGRSGK